MSNAPGVNLCAYLEDIVAAPVVAFNKGADRLAWIDLSTSNAELSPELLESTSRFSKWVDNFISVNAARYAVGGYNERRIIYTRSSHFDTDDESRELHLGIDIWAPAGTQVCTPLEATVHSFKFNDGFGDYGATIILEHQFNATTFYSLFGHLSLTSIEGLTRGQ